MASEAITMLTLREAKDLVEDAIVENEARTITYIPSSVPATKYFNKIEAIKLLRFSSKRHGERCYIEGFNAGQAHGAEQVEAYQEPALTNREIALLSIMLGNLINVDSDFDNIHNDMRAIRTKLMGMIK